MEEPIHGSRESTQALATAAQLRNRPALEACLSNRQILLATSPLLIDDAPQSDNL
jgi:hypothetical protein